MDGNDTQLQTKYQKIATEYSKIRAQVNVLKKAILDEQARNADVREQLKGKEVELRRAEQELDSLTFRNQQLTKRITVLQEELDKVPSKQRKEKSKLSDGAGQVPVSAANHIFDEEFQKKIVENAQLLSEISDKETEIDNLHERIQQLEYKLQNCEKSKLELECKYQNIVDKVERERSELQRKLNEHIKHKEAVSWSIQEDARKSSEPYSDNKPIEKVTETDKPDISDACELQKELVQCKAKYHILKIKYDDLQNKKLSNNDYIEKNALQPTEINNMVGRLIAPFIMPEEIEAREARIRDYFLQEIDKAIMAKHMSHVKNLGLAANNEVLQAHLKSSEQKREECEQTLREALSNYIILQKDKEIQEGNYKAQLSTMSEHLANMNEKLISQTEEIQQLKYELANKSSKKGKQK